MDLDPFDDVFSDQLPASRPGARAGGKFQPKRNAKPQPKNSTSDPAAPSNQAPYSTIPSNNHLNEKQGQLPPGSTNAGEWRSHIEKSPGGKNCDIYIGLDSFDDSLPQSATIPTETPPVHDSDCQNAKDGLMDPGLWNTANACTRLEGPAHLDTLMGEEGAVLNKGGTFHLESRTEETQNAEDFPSLETIDLMSQPTNTSGQRIDKFQHEPMLQPCQTKQCDMVPNPEEIEYGSFVDSVPSQTECMVQNSAPAFPEDDAIDLSSIGCSDSIHTDLTSDFQMNDERTKWTGTSHTDDILRGEHLEAVCEMPGKRTKRGKRKDPMSPSLSLEHQNASTSTPADQVGRSSGRLRKQINKFQLLDESENDDCNDGHGLENEDNDNIDPDYVVENAGNDNIDPECVIENECLNGRRRTRSKKPTGEKEKPVRKRKKVNGELVEPTKAPKKKFSHSTRRNRRRVNPDLLKVPEDEMDFHNLPLKTRIWLAEHKERIEKSEATTSETPLPNQSVGSFSGYHDEEETSQGRDSADEYANSMVPETSTGFNYHTHMKRTPRARWSKQDTELFYEVLQQFGSDLAMIAECFPGRTRQQIKLKYKKEERQNPARLHDALATRSKGSSHFEVVIERLQQIAAQKQDENSDDQINLTGEETEEVAADVNEAPKSEMRNEEVQDMEPEDIPVPAVETSLKSDESEDDEFMWSQYKSEI